MSPNLSTVCFWADFGISYAIFQLRVKREATV